MEKFAGYGFNKSHAAAYALLAYQTAYMKAHHAAAFMAANLSAVMDDTDKVRQFHEDARGERPRRCCRPTSTPREYRFVPVDREDRALRPGRGARHRASRRSRAILEARKRRRRSRTCSTSAAASTSACVNRRCGRGAGARGRLRLRSTRTARGLLASRRRARSRRAEQAERAASQNSLFGEGGSAARAAPHAYVEAAPWDLKQKLTGGEGGARLLPVRAPVLRLRARARRIPAHAAGKARRVAAPGLRSPASSPPRARR